MTRLHLFCLKNAMLAVNLGEHEVEDVLDDLATLYQLYPRNDDTFLEHLPECADRRGRAAADIHVVGKAGGVADQLPFVVNWAD